MQDSIRLRTTVQIQQNHSLCCQVSGNYDSHWWRRGIARKTKATVDDDGGSELHQRSSRKTTNSTATEANKRPIAAQKQAAEGKQLGPAICETIGVVEFSWCTCVRTDGVALCA
ncbi:hypothetical protein YC2023_066943 [Brassica napus]